MRAWAQHRVRSYIRLYDLSEWGSDLYLYVKRGGFLIVRV